MNSGSVVEGTVLNESYGIGNSNYSFNTLVCLRTVEKGGSNAVFVKGIENTAYRSKLSRAVFNGDVLKLRAVVEYEIERLIFKIGVLSNAVKGIFNAFLISKSSLRKLNVGDMRICKCIRADNQRSSAALGEGNGTKTCVAGA